MICCRWVIYGLAQYASKMSVNKSKKKHRRLSYNSVKKKFGNFSDDHNDPLIDQIEPQEHLVEIRSNKANDNNESVGQKGEAQNRNYPNEGAKNVCQERIPTSKENMDNRAALQKSDKTEAKPTLLALARAFNRDQDQKTPKDLLAL